MIVDGEERFLSISMSVVVYATVFRSQPATVQNIHLIHISP